MAEYIEREALIAAYDAAHKGEPGGARKLIADAPAADVVAVVHGRWNSACADEFYFCSLCNGAMDYPSCYCPNCGARMDGAE